MNTDEDQSVSMCKFCAAYLQKRESDKKWIEYWVILRGHYMVFYSEKCNGERDYLRGFIEVSPKTKCLITERRKYHFPFFMATERAKYYFKCPSAVRRHDWIHAINSACKALIQVAPNAQENLAIDRSPEICPTNISFDTTTSSDLSTDTENSPTADNGVQTKDADAALASYGGVTETDTTAPHIILVGSNHDRTTAATNFLSDFTAVTETEGSTNSESDESLITSSLQTQRQQHTVFRYSMPRSDAKTSHNMLNVTNFLPRPSTSPERTPSHLFNVPMKVGNQINARTFSRHFVSSAPDIQTLLIEDT